MFQDPYADTAKSVIAPAADCFAIVPNDSAELAKGTKAIFIGTGGDIVLKSVASEADVTFRNLPDGSILDVRVRAVRATGTTASDIVGLA